MTKLEAAQAIIDAQGVCTPIACMECPFSSVNHPSGKGCITNGSRQEVEHKSTDRALVVAAKAYIAREGSDPGVKYDVWLVTGGRDVKAYLAKKFDKLNYPPYRAAAFRTPEEADAFRLGIQAAIGGEITRGVCLSGEEAQAVTDELERMAAVKRRNLAKSIVRSKGHCTGLNCRFCFIQPPCPSISAESDDERLQTANGYQ